MSKIVRERFARTVSMKVKAGKIDELRKTYRKIKQNIKQQKGIRRIYFMQSTEASNEFISTTFWNSEKDAQAYESGDYKKNISKVKDLILEDATLKSYNILEHAVGLQLKGKRK